MILTGRQATGRSDYPFETQTRSGRWSAAKGEVYQFKNR